MVTRHSSVLTRFRFTVWEVQLTDIALRTLDAEQRPSRHLGSRLEEHFIPDQSLVHDLPLVSHVKHQPSQRTLEHTWAGEREPVRHRMVLRKTPVYYNLGLVFTVLAFIPIRALFLPKLLLATLRHYYNNNFRRRKKQAFQSANWQARLQGEMINVHFSFFPVGKQRHQRTVTNGYVVTTATHTGRLVMSGHTNAIGSHTQKTQCE